MNSFYHQKTSVLTVRKLRRLQYWRLFRPTKIATIYTYSKKCNAADVRTEKCVNVSTWREVCIGGWAMKFNASRTAMQNVVQSVPATVPSLVWWYWHHVWDYYSPTRVQTATKIATNLYIWRGHSAGCPYIIRRAITSIMSCTRPKAALPSRVHCILRMSSARDIPTNWHFNFTLLATTLSTHYIWLLARSSSPRLRKKTD